MAPLPAPQKPPVQAPTAQSAVAPQGAPDGSLQAPATQTPLAHSVVFAQPVHMPVAAGHHPEVHSTSCEHTEPTGLLQ
jgi:hypothetical protein